MNALDMTKQYLTELSLKGIDEHLSIRVKEAMDANLDYKGFLNLILSDEILHRKNLKQKRLLKAAGFRCQASLEGIIYDKSRNIDKKLINELRTLSFLNNGLNIMMFGATGVGKTYLATAIGNHACRHGRSVLFMKMNLLLERLALARAEGNYLRFLKKIRSVDLLIVDDFGIQALNEQQYQYFYDALDEREYEKSTVVTTQVPPENWNEIIQDAVVCEAISDRVTACAIKVHIKGPSQRGRTKKINLDKES